MKHFIYYTKILVAITLCIAALGFFSCNNKNELEQPLDVYFNSEEEVNSTTIEATQSGIFIIIETNDEWQIEIEPATWCTTSTLSGSGNKNVWLSTTTNRLETARTAHITVRAGDESETLTLTQSGATEIGGGDDDDDDDDDDPEPTLSINFSGNTPITWDASGIGITIQSNVQWEVTIAYPSGTSAWCSAAPQSATGNASVWITTTSNSLTTQRTATITVTADALQKSLTLTQNGKPAVSVPARLELPQVNETEWFLEYTKGQFAMEYDITKKHAKWVAFPLHKGHYGSSGRTNAWRQDSRIPPEYRAVQSDFSGYDRGHMCSSGERTKSVEMNQETFYYSNMSPQLAGLNQGVWGQLENFERNWTQSTNDTLYICCGGAITNGQPIIKYNNGLAIPKYYFKVFLRKRGNNTYHAIGFWFENKDYPQRTKAYFLSIRNELVRSVDEIEQLTGLDFFHALPKEIQDVVETQKNLNDWNWN